MALEAGGLVAVTILALDIWAVTSVINARRRWTVKLAWIVGILLFPVLGFLAWLIAGPRPS